MNTRQSLVMADVVCWCTIIYGDDSPLPHSPRLGFLRLMTWHPEFRNLYYHRLGPGV